MASKLLSTLLLFVAVLSSVGLISCYWNVGLLSIQSASQLATIVGSVVGAVSLTFIARQFQLQTQLARASNSQSFVNLSSAFTSKVVDDGELIKIWYGGAAGYAGFSAVEKDKYKQLVAWWLTFYENMQYQHKCGLLDRDVYEGWNADMDQFIVKRMVESLWVDIKKSYRSDFAEYVDGRIAELGRTPPTP